MVLQMLSQILTRGQFHQHFTQGFFVQKFRAKVFVLEVKVKLFIGAKKMVQLRSKNVGEIDSRLPWLVEPS